ncbi:MAG: methyltransferase domain-containing protein [Alphaproteobacteria bacterium]|nr:MAG: methyltransferase domain-containing protein [Alphaproteobacteria bacterium]
MGREINLLRALPKKVKRNVAARKADKEKNREIALRFGYEYFDGPREQGYGGYYYDGRWVPVAREIVAHFGLRPGSRVLDVGCAKGFLVKDLLAVCPGIEAFGLDISEYALMNCAPEVIGRLHLGSADHLPFPDGSFDAVVSINTVHNLDRARCIAALREIERLAPGRGFVQVDAYRTPEEKALFEDWMLTAKTYLTPEGWLATFAEAGYTGDYYWTILEPDPEFTITDTARS